MKKTHVALIGLGNWGRNILKTLIELNCKVTVVHRGSQVSQAFLDEQYPQVAHTTDFNLVLDDPNIRFVCVATPINSHDEIVDVALAKAKHVFVEKPLTTDHETALELHEKATQKDLQLVSGYQYLFDPSLPILKEHIENSSHTDLKLTWLKWGSFHSPITTNLLVHELALAHVLMGKMISVERSVLHEDQLMVRALYDRGTVVFSIDRKQKQKQKRIEAVIGNQSYTLQDGVLKHGTTDIINSGDTSQLLKSELSAFLNNKRTYDWALIDCEVARVLDLLLQ